MEILLRAFRVDIRIAGVNFFCPLVVGLSALDAPPLCLANRNMAYAITVPPLSYLGTRERRIPITTF